MKNILIALIVLSTFVGCKKGENDPGISFRGRDARVVGEWKVSSMNEETNTQDGTPVKNNRSRTDKFDGSKKTTTVVVDGKTINQTPDDNKYEVKININKDGSIEYTETTTSVNGVVNTYSNTGTWNWLDSKKNKSTVLLSFSGATLNSGIYDIDQLKNKEMIFKSESETSDKTTGQASASDQVVKTSMSVTLTQ